MGCQGSKLDRKDEVYGPTAENPTMNRDPHNTGVRRSSSKLLGQKKSGTGILIVSASSSASSLQSRPEFVYWSGSDRTNLASMASSRRGTGCRISPSGSVSSGPPRLELNLGDGSYQYRDRNEFPTNTLQGNGRPITKPLLQELEENLKFQKLRSEVHLSATYCEPSHMEDRFKTFPSLTKKASLPHKMPLQSPKQNFMPVDLAPIKGGLSRSGFLKGESGRSGFVNDVPSRTGSVKDVPSRTGSVKDVPSRTGSVKDVPSRTGSVKDVPSRTGSVKDVPSRTGSVKNVPSRTGSVKDVPSRTGSFKSIHGQQPQNHIQTQPQNYPERKSPLPPDFPNAGSPYPMAGNPYPIPGNPYPVPGSPRRNSGTTFLSSSPPSTAYTDYRYFSKKNRQVYIAKSPWNHPGDLNVARYEKLELVTKQETDKWFMKSKVTGSKGLVPRHILALVDDLECKDWFHGAISREEAEDRLKKAGKHGTFLIRHSNSNHNDYALSLLDGDLVKHYRIREHDTGGYFIDRQSSTFTTIDKLVEHYSTRRELCARLVVPCYNVPARAVPEDPAWELDRASLALGRELGSGQFGVVREATLSLADPRESKVYHVCQVAVKELKKGRGNVTDFLAEVTALKKLKHERLLRLVGVCTDKEPYLMVTEFMKNGSLLSYLKSQNGKALVKEELLHIALQVAEGMQYLEEQHYVHRDLAARNVLLDDRLNVKIADFGLSKLATATDEAAEDCSRSLPVKWTALEAFGEGAFTSKSDVWSFGVLFFEIMTHGLTPYRDMTNKQAMDYVRGGYRMPQEPCVDISCYNLMLECWSKLPHNRPTFFRLREKITDLIKEVKKNIRDYAFDQSFIEK